MKARTRADLNQKAKRAQLKRAGASALHPGVFSDREQTGGDVDE